MKRSIWAVAVAAGAVGAGAVGSLGAEVHAQTLLAQTQPVQTQPVQTQPAPPAPIETAPAVPPAAPPAAATVPPAQPTPAAPAAAPVPAGQSELPPVEIIQKQPPKPAPRIEAAPQPKAQPKPATPVAQTAPAPKAKAAAKQAPAQQPAAAPQLDPSPAVVDATSVDVQRAAGDLVRTTPYGNSEIAIEKVPGSVSTVSAATIAESGSNEPQDVLQKNVPGIVISDASGNELRAQIEYRGFGAGSVNGFPQGLAVYQGGIRVNEVFGDTVNWDMIPKNAIADMTVLSGNPIFGLNAIGGAVSVVMKDGFQFQGVEIDVMGGSFGRKQIGVQVGQRSGPFALYFAGEAIEENGWRDFSPSEVKRAYIDLGFKRDGVEAHFNLTMADSAAGVVTASPVELLAIERSRTYTSPQTTELEVLMPSFNASVKVTDTLTLSGLAYYRRFRSKVIDGNLFGGDVCSEVLADALLTNPAAVLAAGVAPTDICSSELEGNEVVAVESGGANIDSGAVAEPYGVIDHINTRSESFGFNVQAADKRTIFGHNNHFVVGASYDQGKVDYRTKSELGAMGDRFVITGTGLVLDEPDDFASRHVAVDTRYLGIYMLNALDITDRLTLTFGGRFNYAKIELEDLTGDFPDITSQHSFQRFNPTVGATYQLVPGITLFGGYAEANRAPTAAELACANPDNPCPIESFLTDDPPLEQVVSRSFEIGLRGKMKSHDGLQRLDWGLSAFRTLNQDDILFVASNVTGRGFFFNAGETLRQGLEASLKYKYGPLSTYASYSYIRATYETPNEFSSPNNPFAAPCAADPTSDCIAVEKGDSIPGIPNHRFKAGFDYHVTPHWKVGADLMYTSGQHFFGDEANLLDKLGGYTRVDLSTSYDLTSNIQIYAFAKNVFDRKYGLFGTLFDADEAPGEIVGPAFTFTDPRSVVPAAPVSIYGGVKVKF